MRVVLFSCWTVPFTCYNLLHNMLSTWFKHTPSSCCHNYCMWLLLYSLWLIKSIDWCVKRKFFTLQDLEVEVVEALWTLESPLSMKRQHWVFPLSHSVFRCWLTFLLSWATAAAFPWVTLFLLVVSGECWWHHWNVTKIKKSSHHSRDCGISAIFPAW